MRKFLSLAAAAATAFAVSGVQAQILVDDFNLPSGVDTFTSGTIQNGGAAITHTYTKAGGTISAASLATQRDVTVDLTTAFLNTSTQTLTASVGGGATGDLNFNAGTGNTGTAAVAWTLPSFSALPPGSTYFFSVLASTVGSTAATQISFSFTGTGTNAGNNFSVAAQNVPSVAASSVGTPLAYNILPTDATKLAGGGILTMNITGGQGWNLDLDQFAFSVPEPTSLALVGLALVGAGVASRRRKA